MMGESVHDGSPGIIFFLQSVDRTTVKINENNSKMYAAVNLNVKTIHIFYSRVEQKHIRSIQR